MQDSDDYFTDDFVLDEHALAVLDEEEHKYTLSTQNHAPSFVPPPPKRLKTETGWRSGHRRAETIDDLDDLPEISVQGDGSYGLHARHAAAASARPSSVRVAIPVNGVQPQSTSSSRYPLTRTASSSSSAAQHHRSPAANQQLPRRHTSNSTLSHTSSINPVSHSQSSRGAQLSAKSISVQGESDVGAQVDELRRQMEEVRHF